MRVAVILTARPSWAKLEPVCRALKARPEVDLQIIACASALLERYGKVVDVVKQQGYAIAAECWTVHEGENLITSAKETGALLSELCGVLQRMRSDCVVVCADRHEVLAAAQAGSYLHVPTIHMQGGEHTGSIDDKVRDAITQLADCHCVCTERAKYRVYGLTGDWAHIYNTGCPSIDLAKQTRSEPPVTAEELHGTGPQMDLARPFLIVLQHSVTSEAYAAGDQMRMTLEAVCQIPLPRIVFAPGEDAGANLVGRAIREWRHTHPERTMYTVKNFPPTRFLRLLAQCACMVGNSSAGIRESAFLGVPVVNLGSRQLGRERGPNVVDVPHETEAIVQAVTQQIAHGPYSSSTIYGSGTAGEEIAEVICNRWLSSRAASVVAAS